LKRESGGVKDSTYEFSTVRFPSRDLVLAGHGQMNGIDHHTIPRRLCGRRRGCDAIRRIQETLVVARFVLLVEPGGKTEIGQLDMTVLVD